MIWIEGSPTLDDSQFPELAKLLMTKGTEEVNDGGPPLPAHSGDILSL